MAGYHFLDIPDRKIDHGALDRTQQFPYRRRDNHADAGLGNDLFEFRSKIFKNYNSFYFRILKLILHLMSRIQWIGGNQYQTGLEARSEERRVGKEGRFRW